jgi:DMSO/TMAO reductase YedYZ molybdopterin-dependent catalytic subunit
LAGLVAAGLALGVTELIAAFFGGAPSLAVSVGSAIIAFQPAGAKDLVVSWFGTNDKLALNLLVLVVALALGAGIGILGRTRRDLANAAIAGLALLGFLASLLDPQTSMLLAAVSAGVAALVGTQALGWLLRRAGAAVSTDPASIDAAGRRRFLLSAGGLGVLAIAGGGLGRVLLERKAGQVDATEALIPPAAEPAAAIPAGADLGIAGVTPLVMPNDRFYRIDTALLTPSIDVSSWSLRVHGMVDRETTLTFEELVALPLVERYVTIACVSNEVGGDLVGNTKWTGVRLTEVLDIAGVKPGATQIVPRSVDGWTAGFPTAWVTAQERDALIAVKMNDQPLPSIHGYPARLIVPGLYGYVSATKWLTDIELTTLEAFDAYWVRLGWAKEGPILTQSRIDVPSSGSSVSRGGVVPVAGVAWAPERGISAVEISVDGGAWQPATLATAISDQTWVQWRYDWPSADAATGAHELRVRATDGTGTPQDEGPSPPAPDGARGYHAISVTVS